MVDDDLKKLFESNAEEDEALALIKLGDSIYEQGDLKESFKYYEKAAKMGNAKAQFEVGNYYHVGWVGTSGFLKKKDHERAHYWFKKSADQGDYGGQFGLGVMYNRGDYVKKDKREAKRLFMLSAEQDFSIAQYNIGQFYRKGEGGCVKDERKAIEYYKLAAENGFDKAIKILKAVYGLSVRPKPTAGESITQMLEAVQSKPPDDIDDELAEEEDELDEAFRELDEDIQEQLKEETEIRLQKVKDLEEKGLISAEEASQKRREILQEL